MKRNMSLHKEDLSFRRNLEKEIDLWLKEGILLPDQKERILARYKVLKAAEEKAGPGRLITTLSILGSILVGIGVILFVASNWSALPNWGRLFIVFSSMLASYGFGFYLRYETRNYPKVGASLILLGSLIFGAGMFLIAQIYHITVHYPNGPLLWGLFVLPLAYLLRFKSLLSLAILVLLIWLGMEAHLQALQSISLHPATLIPLFFMAGIVLWGIGLVHRERESLKIISSPYILIGTLITFVAGYVLTFSLYGERFKSDALFIFYPGIGVLFLLAVIARCLPGEKERGWIPETLGLVVLMIIVIFLSLFFPKASPTSVRGDLRLFLNILFALEIVGLIILGFIRRFPVYVNIGLLFFALDVIARYFDFFWELLPRSLFFILGGLLLLFGGILLERKRRKILSSFDIEEVDG
ncbi:MAG TPA: DUF2157 domain-containing protein [Thermodesulfobacteriota bacterium]|nr:DUF2157 domain-containing protein [Thermodesulfobacteriota bacterium]